LEHSFIYRASLQTHKTPHLFAHFEIVTVPTEINSSPFHNESNRFFAGKAKQG
jgi:hypothetical protein